VVTPLAKTSLIVRSWAASTPGDAAFRMVLGLDAFHDNRDVQLLCNADEAAHAARIFQSQPHRSLRQH
jgi:hypothetical protein